MLNIGKRITELRKAKNWSQEDLAKEINSSRIMIGKYEREDNAPSIEVLFKLSKVFNVSLDYLVGEAVNSHFNKEVLKRIEDIEQLDEETRNKLFFLIDNVIQNYKTKEAFK